MKIDYNELMDNGNNGSLLVNTKVISFTSFPFTKYFVVLVRSMSPNSSTGSFMNSIKDFTICNGHGIFACP